MKKIFLLAIVLLTGSYVLLAGTARVVQENASCTSCSPPLYPTISAAVAASSAGDTIFVKNRAGDVPYLENVTITISLDIVPYTYDSAFYCQGNWTITPATAGTVIDIIGMNNTAGNIVTAAAAPTGTRTTVRILDCVLNSGYVYFPFNYFDIQLYGTKIINSSGAQPSVDIFHGAIIGDSIYQTGSNQLVSIGNDGLTGDTLCIIGNFLSLQDCTSCGHSCIYWNSSDLFFDIRNNYMISDDYYYQLYIVTQYSTTAYSPYNKIYNNTIISNQTYSTTHSVYITGGAAGSFTDVQNNMITRTLSGAVYGVYNGGSGVVNSYYNWVDKNFTSGNSYNTYGGTGNNYSLTNITGNLGTGTSLSYPISPISTSAPASGASQALTSLGYYNSGSYFATYNPVGAGNPGNLFYNLINVTTSNTPLSYPNTIGCYGGPFSIQNFFPMYSNASGSAFPRVYMTTSYLQSIVNGSGATWGFKATGFSR